MMSAVCYNCLMRGLTVWNFHVIKYLSATPLVASIEITGHVLVRFFIYFFIESARFQRYLIRILITSLINQLFVLFYFSTYQIYYPDTLHFMSVFRGVWKHLYFTSLVLSFPSELQIITNGYLFSWRRSLNMSLVLCERQAVVVFRNIGIVFIITLEKYLVQLWT